MNNVAGKVIAFEGLDGSGKSTQLKQTAAWLESQGLKARQLREPTDGPIGQKIRRLAREGRLDVEQEMRLFLEDRTQNVADNIKPGVESGEVILLDRYYISSMAYQGARGLDPAFVQQENEKIAPRPDLILMFDIPVAVGLERIHAREGAGPDEFEGESYLAKVKGIFDSLQWPEIVRIDANRTQEEVEASVREEISKYF